MYKKADSLHVQESDTAEVLLHFRSGGMEAPSRSFPKARSPGQSSGSQLLILETLHTGITHLVFSPLTSAYIVMSLII